MPDNYAAGDVASRSSLRYRRRLRLESVQNAIEQAKIAAAVMLGNTAIYDLVPWFRSDQFDFKLQIAGLWDGATRTEFSLTEGRGTIRYLDGDQLLAVDSLNDPKSHLFARKALAEATHIASAA